jgi:hypothetical protein
MPTSLPPSVRASLGEEGADDFVRWLDDYLQARTVLRDERPDGSDPSDCQGGRALGAYREVPSRLDETAKPLECEPLDTKKTASARRTDARVNRLEDQLHELRDRLHEQRSRFDQRIDEVQFRSQTRWLVGTISFFGILLTVILSVSLFSG